MGDRPSIEQVDADLRRVSDAADGLVRAAQEVRASLDALSENVRAVVREADESPPRPAAPPAPASPPVAESEPESESTADGDATDAARIVALNMALDGTSREDVAAHLNDEFSLSDPDSLLDDVYARIG